MLRNQARTDDAMKGQAGVRITVAEDSHAQAVSDFYRKVGYQDVGCVSNYIRILRGGKVAARIDFDALGIDRGPAVVRRLVPLAQRIGLASLGGIALGAALRFRAALARGAARDHEIGTSR